MEVYFRCTSVYFFFTWVCMYECEQSKCYSHIETPHDQRCNDSVMLTGCRCRQNLFHTCRSCQWRHDKHIQIHRHPRPNIHTQKGTETYLNGSQLFCSQLIAVPVLKLSPIMNERHIKDIASKGYVCVLFLTLRQLLCGVVRDLQPKYTYYSHTQGQSTTSHPKIKATEIKQLCHGYT